MQSRMEQEPSWTTVDMRVSAMAYHEPSVVTILTQSSFLLASNVIDNVLNSLLYCGLVGQILVGVAWGTPGAHLLAQDSEAVIVQLGYLGLVLIVFQGTAEPGRSTRDV